MFQISGRFTLGGHAAWILACLFVLSLGFNQPTFAEKKADTRKDSKLAMRFALKGPTTKLTNCPTSKANAASSWRGTRRL